MLESGALVPLDDSGAGATHVISSPIWIDGAPRTRPSRAPGIGEHSAAILRELGYSADEIDTLRESGAIAGASDSLPAASPTAA